ncbi:MAG: o-succinylbenzoate--CoA ligase [Myxococcaceae bacterium]|nr:o-succinylbenzoate--CoA ligase [Myxococcaceae bacterium]
MSARVCPIRHWAERTPEAIAVIGEGRVWRYRDLDLEVTRKEEALRALGARLKSRIAVLGWNSVQKICDFHAAARVGATWVPLNARLAVPERDALLHRIRPALVLGEGDIARQVDADMGTDGEAPRAILFTSGTTGTPRGAELTFGNFDALARASGANLGADPAQRWLLCMPMFHIGGLALVHRCAVYGASVVLHERFDAHAVLRSLHEDDITHLSVVPTQLKWLLDADGRRAPPHLRAVLVGGAAASADLLARARERGFPVLHTYGLTEACSQVATERLAEADGTTSGRPLDGVEVRIDRDGGIQVRGPTVMRGYFEDATATANVFTEDGWLKTGDLGELDERGRLKVHARRSDLIVSGGENVYPAEIEAVLARHPAIAEAAVTALPDPTWGQVPAALWVARPAMEPLPTEASLIAFCRAHLAGFKVPRRFAQVPALPRTANGKLDRKAIAAHFAVPEVHEVLNLVNEHDQRT